MTATRPKCSTCLWFITGRQLAHPKWRVCQDGDVVHAGTAACVAYCDAQIYDDLQKQQPDVEEESGGAE